MKNTILITLLILVWACNTPSGETLQAYAINGETMGTTYSVLYVGPSESDYSEGIDLLLKQVNQETSTYIPASTISKFNQSETGLSFPEGAPEHFKTVFEGSKIIWEQTKGHFDPTVMPVVNYWGFGYTEKKPVTAVDTVKVDSLLQLIGFAKISSGPADAGSGKGDNYTKKQGMQLDFSAIAKGYGVDAVGQFLESKGISNYLVEIGGEVRARGKKSNGDWWTAGINIPDSAAGLQDIQNAVSIQNKALATSGNYRIFYEVDGVKYAHTINPSTGFPAGNTLLSASVLANDCMTADAFATAFMVMGLDKAYQLAAANEGIEAYLIYGDDAGEMKIKYTPGIAPFIANK
ncbi:MAG: FAD:protein FMN transferase [Bacteroidota bacterium]